MSGPEEPEPPLLLHSLATFSREILGSLDIVAPRRIVEIGSESGDFTAELEGWASRNDALVVSVDPGPAESTVELARDSPHLELVEAASPEALGGLEPAQVYIVDGDHNYATVSVELEHALAGGNQPLVVLHDVGWPCARRDAYYEPERLDPADRLGYSFYAGVKPGRSELGTDGFSGAGAMAFAEREGGAHNGVLTAVEDFAAARGGLSLVRIPCVFGLGFLFPQAAPWADELSEALAPFDESPLLATMEQNRVTLYLRVLDLHAELRAQRQRAERAIKRAARAEGGG